MRLIGKLGTPKNPKRFMGTIYRNALPDLADRDNPRLARLMQADLDAADPAVDTLANPEPQQIPPTVTEPESVAKQPKNPTPTPASVKKKKAKTATAKKSAAIEQTLAPVETSAQPEPMSQPEPNHGPDIEAEPQIEPKPKRHVWRSVATRVKSIRLRVSVPKPRLPAKVRNFHPSVHLPKPIVVKRPKLPTKTAAATKPIPIPTPVTANAAIQDTSEAPTKPVLNAFLLTLVPLTIAATQVTLYMQPIAGAYVNAATLAYLTGLALWSTRYRALCIVVSLIPTANMVVLSLPGAAPFVRTATLYSFLLVFGLIYRHLIVLDKPDSPSGRLGTKGYVHLLPAMIVGGQLLGLIGYGLLRHHYAYSDTLTPIVAASAIIFALAEEIVFRGLIQHQASRVMRPLWAGTLSTAVFTSLTVGQGMPWAPLFAVLLGASLAYTYHRKPNILLTWVLNTACKLTFLGLLSAIS